MPWSAISFALGVAIVQQLAVLPAPTFGWGALLLGALCWWAPRFKLLSRPGALLFGLGWALVMAQARLDDALPADSIGRDITVTGVVRDLPQPFERGVRFTFQVEEADAPVPARLSLAWYRQIEFRDDEQDAEPAPSTLPAPRGGERWRLVVRLKPPHGALNPHGFDYAGWLFERGIRATGYVRKSTETARLGQAAGFSASLARWRDDLRSGMRRQLGESPYAGVLIALAIGDQAAIAPDLWRLFAATGITHLMSISGLHVTLLGLLVAGMVNRLWRRSARLPLIWPAQKAAALAGLGGAAVYALLAGFGVPAQRTLYMLAVATLALLSGRSFAAGQVLGAALVLVLLIDPWAVMAAGFWLSFGAVALLFYAASGQVASWWRGWLRAQWAITLGLAPLLLALFQQFSLVSPLANVLAIPLVSLLVTPLALLGTVPGLRWALDLAHGLLTPLMEFLAWLAVWPGALWQQAAPPAWTVPLAVLGGLVLLLPRGFPARWLGAVLWLPLLWIVPERPAPGEWQLTVLDVGQGQALHVQTSTHDLLFDTGPDYGGSDAGARVIVPYLRAVGVVRLDRLIVSHADRDHAGGADSVLAAIPAVAVERRCAAGTEWQWDGVRFRVLHPPEEDYADKRPTNALSCVLKIDGTHGSGLLPGDVEGKAEAALIDRDAEAMHADVLIAPHHGGKKTASPAFVDAVGAREVIFPVGYRNRFGHPNAAVLARYEASGAEIHRTDRDGAITVNVGAGGTAVTLERERQGRYWQAHP